MDEEIRDVETQKRPEVPASSPGVLSSLDELLRRPELVVARAERRETAPLYRLLAGAVLCFAAYGVASGFFQGGGQVLVTAFKVPLIVFASLGLCLPSFYVLAALAGVEVSLRWLAGAIVGLAGMLGLLLIALMPIAWLFSVSTSSLGFIVMLHVAVWLTAVAFAYRFLGAISRERGGGALVAWTLIFILVSFQVASQMRPVLWRPDGMPVFSPQKMFFLEHVGRVFEDGSR